MTLLKQPPVEHCCWAPRRLSAMRLQKTVRRFGSLGMLYDSTLCVGCQACVTKCQDINFPARNPEGEQTWSNNDKLSPYTNNIIQVWRSGTGVNKDQEENGYAYIKKQCMHCVDPNCVSVCPVSALKKIRKPASSTMTKMSAPAAVTVWSPARTTYLSTTTTTRLARFTSVSCVTRKALSVWIKAVCWVRGSLSGRGRHFRYS